MSEAAFLPLDYIEYPTDEMRSRAETYYHEMKRRRTVRMYSDRAVDRAVLEHAILTAGTAPNGANLQPWHFVVVSDPEVKRQMRIAAEAEEREFYERRATGDWLEALEPFATDAHKPFLEEAPYLIVVFAQSYQLKSNGNKTKNYYVNESVGIATGLLISALHHAGLATLTHTPSPMNFLSDILERPVNERAYLILVVGYPAEDAIVPVIKKKELHEIASFR